jgi:hypothetical protein
MGEHGDLLEEARARLHELEEAAGDELGDRVELEPGEHFAGRYRGQLTMRTKDGDQVMVVGLWDASSRPRFMYRRTALAAELEETRPSIGDEIVIVRGDDRVWETADGEPRRMYRYSVAVRPSTEAPPEAASAAAPAPPPSEPVDDGIPF